MRIRALGLRAISLLRAGRLAEALAAAEDGLSEAKATSWRHELLAVRFDTARPPRSEHRGHGDWVEALRGR